jgi:hypothetical protein
MAMKHRVVQLVTMLSVIAGVALAGGASLRGL